MPDVASVLKEEILRLARKEAKAAAEPLHKQIRELRDTVKGQRDRIESLEKELSRKADKITEPQVSVEAPDNEEEIDIRIPKGSIKKHRERLGLSQEEFGLLLDVSALTVGNWENERTQPSLENRLAFAELRKMKKREVKQRLEMLAGKAE